MKTMTDAKAVFSTKSFNTLANQITILRILLIPLIFILLIERKILWGVILLSFCTFTDFLDGLAARLRGERTKVGAFLDPMADKLLLTTVYLALMTMDLIDTWVFVVIFSRDLLIVLGWSVIYILTGNSHISPRRLGKITTAVQMITALFCMIQAPHPLPHFFIWLTVGTTIASAIDYIIVGEKRLGQWNS